MPTYKLRDVDVEFPYDAYPCQLDYMSTVIQALQEKNNALLESPTGTGKTLCLLCATLAWRASLQQAAASAPEQIRAAEPHVSELVQGLREDFAEMKAERALQGDSLPTIVYSSRTHSQLKQVMQELRTTAYRPRTAILGSRQQSCLHPSVQGMPSSAANQACRSLTSTRTCKWHFNIERFTKSNPDLNSTVLDIEELTKLGTTRTLCPYFLSREMATTAEIVFMPYNYLVDVKTRGGLGIAWHNAVLIFDEAHNVEGVCADAASFDLTAPTLAGAIEEIGTAAELAAAQAEGVRANVANQYGNLNDNTGLLATAATLRQLQLVLRRLEQEIASIKISPEKGYTQNGSFLFDLLSRLNLTAATWLEMSAVVEKAMSLLTTDAVEGGRRGGSRSTSYKLHALHDALSLAFSTYIEGPNGEPNPSSPHHGYRVHVHLERHRATDVPLPTLSYWCFSPGQTMTALTEMNVRSILLTSGTLAPLGSFAQELSIPFPVRLENPHVIDPSQVWIGVVPRGPQGHALNSSYQTRNAPEYKEDLGNAIVNFARIVPDGLLVFFPSYRVLQTCKETWTTPGAGGATVWERISHWKAPVLEPHNAALFPAAAEDFRAKLDDPSYKGAAFFAVCRGKASEGLDFSDRAGRAVVITGIPYATKTDPKVQIKQQVLNESRSRKLKRPVARCVAGGAPEDDDPGLTGDGWYVQQAIRAVNQAMGRVIRHKNDFGAIILCDERFQQESVQKHMSKWLRDSVRVFPNYGHAIASLTKFFKEAARAPPPVRLHGRHAPPPHNMSTILGKVPGSTFQIATRQPGALTGQPSGGQSLLAAVPAAADLAGLTALVDVPSRGPDLPPSLRQERNHPSSKSGLLEILEGAGRGDASGETTLAKGNADRPLGSLESLLAAGPPNDLKYKPDAANSGFGHATKLGVEYKPWQRSSVDATLLNGQSRARLALRPGAAPIRPVNDDHADGNVVGPSHLLRKHKEQKKENSESHALGLGRRSVFSMQHSTAAPSSSKWTVKECADASIDKSEETDGKGAGSLKCSPGGNKTSENLQDKQRMVQPPPNIDQQKRPSRDFSLIDRLKSELPKESSNLLLAALRKYRIDRDPMPLLHRAAQELQGPERHDVRCAFKCHVPKNLWVVFDDLVLKATSAAAKRIPGDMEHQVQPSLTTGSKGLAMEKSVGLALEAPLKGKEAMSGRPSNGVPIARKDSKETRTKGSSTPACLFCKKSPMEGPHAARCCGQTACFSCWTRSVALRKCECGKPLKKSMLEKKYFI